MKKLIYILSGLLMVGIGLAVGFRMSADAMAVIVGIFFGLVATIPTTLILIYNMRQRDVQQAQNRQQMGQYPPVVVVNSPPGNGGGINYGNRPILTGTGPSERSFKVVGDESTSDTLDSAFNLSSIWDES